MPRMFSTPKPKWILGLRMSRSRMITRLPLNEMMPARLIATKVFPSPEIVLVMAMVLGPGVLSTNWRFVRTRPEGFGDQGLRVLVDQQLARWGSPSCIWAPCPGSRCWHWDSLAISCNEVMLSCRIYRHQHDQEAEDDAREQVVGYQHHVPLRGRSARLAVRHSPGSWFSGTKPALLIRYSMSFSKQQGVVLLVDGEHAVRSVAYSSSFSGSVRKRSSNSFWITSKVIPACALALWFNSLSMLSRTTRFCTSIWCSKRSNGSYVPSRLEVHFLSSFEQVQQRMIVLARMDSYSVPVSKRRSDRTTLISVMGLFRRLGRWP